MIIKEGTRLGPYEVVAPIGAGGMGEVWRGKDTRLGRDVAIKILPAELAQSALFKVRFEREARTISSLNHPNICTLFDVGEVAASSPAGEPLHYLVMELLDGESLADRLAKGPLPLDQVLKYGAQIADALHRAHKQGIVHRDLKPGNIMLTKGGAKLLDFGLARSSVEGAPLQGLTELPTQARPLTQEGTIVGTFQYMAPEQLEGTEADARTDIFAFGAVLYEMATGRRAFQGGTRTSLIAAIVSGTPQPIGEIVPLTPPALEYVVRKCLAKDPDDRWQSAHDVADQLRWISEAGSRAGEAAPVLARRKTKLHLAWALHAVTALLAVAATLAAVYAMREKPRIVRSSVLTPPGTALEVDSGAMALSPDGTRIAFVAQAADGTTTLMVRPINALTAQPLAGTTGARFPFWSPDSRFLGFFSDGKLRKIDAAGGPPQTLCDASDGRGGSWSDDGTTILFTPSTRDPIFKVAAAGGIPSPVTELSGEDEELSHRFPEFLPGGQRFLYLVESTSDSNETVAGFLVLGATLGSTERKHVVATNASVRYDASTGHLLFLRDGTLLAQRFDPVSMELSGEGVPVAETVMRSSRWDAMFSISATGLLAYQQGESSPLSQLVWVTRDGKEELAAVKKGDHREIELSNDEKRVLTVMNDPKLQKSDIWIHDLERGTATRLTFDPSDDYSPLWSPDDRWVYFSSTRSGRGDIFRKSASGTGAEEPVYASPENDLPRSITADSRTLMIMTNNARKKTGWDIQAVDLTTGKAEMFIATPFWEVVPQISPDGSWLLYCSNESGRMEVYVQARGAASGKWQISTDGGSGAEWTKGGREITFNAANGTLMAVDISYAPQFAAGVPTPLFETRRRQLVGRHLTATRDGSRFLVNRTLDRAAATPMTLVQNWPAALAP
ncbi:MAG TPA: protein kinase [Thermoanaerobaculia bacterium]|nr:protein kinase [Thermoanaerobaculia bacterium]